MSIAKQLCLQFLGKVGYAHWIPKVEPFVLQSTLPKALTYYSRQREPVSFLGEITSSQDDQNWAHRFCVAIKQLKQEEEVRKKFPVGLRHAQLFSV